MANVTIDIDELTRTLRSATMASLPWVKLQDVNYSLNEPTPPPYTVNSIPTVMTTPALVPSSSYFWSYKDTRQVILDYVLQRGTNWQTGRVRIFHNMPIDYLNSLDEPTPPPIPSPYTQHQLYFSHTIDLVVGDNCGVTLSAIHGATTNASDEKFGLGFQITSATPYVFPLLCASYVSVIPLT